MEERSRWGRSCRLGGNSSRSSGCHLRHFCRYSTRVATRNRQLRLNHPASNGLAERAVQIVKKGLKKVTAGCIRDRLAKVLMSYCLTPQGTTGISPAELLLGRRPRTLLDLLKPHTAERVERKLLKQKGQHDATAKHRELCVGDCVFVRNYGSGGKWLPGVIERQTGPVSFLVKLTDGRERCHLDQGQETYCSCGGAA